MLRVLPLSYALPLSSGSALGGESAFKNRTADLNTFAPCLLQVRSNYSADKRLLAQGGWHQGCRCRGLATLAPQPLLLPVGIQEKGTKRR